MLMPRTLEEGLWMEDTLRWRLVMRDCLIASSRDADRPHLLRYLCSCADGIFSLSSRLLAACSVRGRWRLSRVTHIALWRGADHDADRLDADLARDAVYPLVVISLRRPFVFPFYAVLFYGCSLLLYAVLFYCCSLLFPPAGLHPSCPPGGCQAGSNNCTSLNPYQLPSPSTLPSILLQLRSIFEMAYAPSAVATFQHLIF